MIFRRSEGPSLFRRATFKLMVGVGLFATPITTYAVTGNSSDAAQANIAAVIAKTTSKPTAEPGRPLPIKIEPRTPSPAEMARTMELMEERVRQLESQLERLSGEVAQRATKAECATALSGVTTAATEIRKNEAVPVVLPEVAAPQVKLTFKSLVKSAKAMLATKPAAPVTTDVSVPSAPQLMPVAPAATAQNASAPAPKKDDGAAIINFFKAVEFSGVVDGYYSYNSNKTDLSNQGRAFDTRHNAFSLQMAKVAFEAKNSKESPLGFRLDLALGDNVDRIASISDQKRNYLTSLILQGYVSYVAPIGKGLTLDIGKFYTPIGGEVVDTKDNFNYSRGFIYWYGGPFYHMGLRAKYAVNDKVAVTGLLVNGWDNVFENNAKGSSKSVGGQISLTPNKRFSITQSYLVGKEAPLANVPATSSRDNMRHISDTLATVYVNDKLTVMGEYT